MDFRKEAEERARKAEESAVSEENRRNSFRIQQKAIQQQRRQSIRNELMINETDYSSQSNETPKIAQLVELDYKWNGGRAKSSGDFMIPRWVPDEEVKYCHSCNSEFDYVNRKHHCRSCGMVYCEPCSTNRVLLPHEYGYKDPKRVCNGCHSKLLPMQPYLTTNIANHQRVNNIDIASTNCNVRRYMNMPFSSTLGSEIRKAAYSTHNLFSQPLHYVRDKAIPLRLLATAKGLAFITVMKGGFIFAPRFGTGLVVARLPESDGGGWSAPTAIATLGVSWGAVIGLDVTDYVVILTTTEAVQAFSGMGQITIGAGIEVAVGPVGRSGSADFHIGDTGLAPALSYSHSRGLFAGLSLDGSVIMARSEVNHCFYGRHVTPLELLQGRVPPPRAAAPLYDALAEAMSSLPDVSHLSRSALQAESWRSSRSSQLAPGISEGDHTSQAIRDIDSALNQSSSSSSSAERVHGSRDSNRRRTVGYAPNGSNTVHDDIWGAPKAAPVVAAPYSIATQPSQTESSQSSIGAMPESGMMDRGADRDAGDLPPVSVTQRKSRPRSLPETRSDKLGGDFQYTTANTSSSSSIGRPAEEMLGDVPRPPPSPATASATTTVYATNPTSSSTSNSSIAGSGVERADGRPFSTGKKNSSLIDEELECVTTNIADH